MGVIYVGPRSDDGWNQAHIAAVQALRAQYADDLVIVERYHIPEENEFTPSWDSLYTPAIEGMIHDDGAGLILSTSFGDDPVILALAETYPDVSFRHITPLEDLTNPKNSGTQYGLINQGHYVNGVAAGLCTNTNKLGFVTSEPVGPVLICVNSFLLGARHTNPEAVVQIAFTDAWTDTAREVQAANALVDAGCDVITCHSDSPGLIVQAAESRGVKTCGHAYDLGALAPKGYITGAEHHWFPMFDKFVRMQTRGEALPNFLTGGYDRDYVRSSPFGAGATPQAINAAEIAMQAMRDGDALIIGPVKDNTGKVVVPAGTTYGPYAPELQQTDYLIEGVVKLKA